MIDINFNKIDCHSRLKAVNKALGGTLTSNCDELQVNATSNDNLYYMRSFDMAHGLNLLLIEFSNYKQDVNLRFSGYAANPLELIFVRQGTILIQENDILIEKLDTNQSLIYASPNSLPYSIIIPKETQTHIVIVEINREEYLEKIECDINKLHKSVQLLLQDTAGDKPYMHVDKIGVTSANAISTIIKTNTEGLERKLILEAATNRLIANFIKMIRIYQEPKNNKYRFDDTDILLIKEVKELIESSPHKTYTVKELSKKIGLNPNKLQKGFKINYGMSIRQYVIKNKLKTALKRLEKQDARIGEIIGDLGYTNTGYFSSLFTKEYGMLPSEYRKIVRA